jgi:hypothetical protein
MVQEFKKLAHGIPGVFNAHTQTPFTLRCWPIVVSGDGPASAEAMGFKKPGGAYRPCHQCLITGDRGDGGNTYYILHTAEDIQEPDLRTDVRVIVELWNEIDDANNKQNKGKFLGITHRSILLDLETHDFPQSFPLDLMHCVLQNLLPQIHALWGGTKQSEAEAAAKEDREFKARLRQLNIEIDEQPLQEQSPILPCVLPPKEWSVIAKYMVESASTIPQLLGKAPRAIDTRHKSFKAMEWEALLVRDGPSLFHHLGPEFKPYLQNFILLRDIFARKVVEDYYS